MVLEKLQVGEVERILHRALPTVGAKEEGEEGEKEEGEER